MFLSKLIGKLSLFAFLIYSISIVAQDTEEVTVVGTQIKGASISSALPVSVYSLDDIEALGIDSGDELLDALWAHVSEPKFSWKNEWEVGDVVMWQNRMVLHRRDSFDPETRRIMHRTQLKGFSSIVA